jgi:HSP20 family protein
MIQLYTWPRSSWSIFDEMDSLQKEMNGVLSNREGSRTWNRTRTAYPSMNVWSSAEGMVIDAELPGVDPQDVDISVLGDELTLSGKVNTKETTKGEEFLRRERPTGEFSRRIQLPFRADAKSVKANYRNGLLRLTVPRPEEEKPRKIAIEAA